MNTTTTAAHRVAVAQARRPATVQRETRDASGALVPCGCVAHPAAFEWVDTLALEEGDIVHTHGMRLRLTAREDYRSNNGHGLQHVRAFRGEVLNPEAIEGDRWLWNMTEQGTAWRVQGNSLATWARETRPAGVCPQG